MKKCKNCNKLFEVTRYWQEFCSEPCRNKWHGKNRLAKCPKCGHSFYAKRGQD